MLSKNCRGSQRYMYEPCFDYGGFRRKRPVWLISAEIGRTAGHKNNLSEQTIANNMDTILLLQEDEWEKLSAQERLDVLQAVANIEQRYLGLPNELNVGVANLDADILGYYTDKTHEIIVSADSLLYDSPWEVLDTICHEAYHSYQYRLVEALNGADENSKNLRIFRKAYTYADEFTSYKDE